MIREALEGVEPRFLSIIIGLLSLIIISATVFYGIKPEYLAFNKNSASLELLRNQMDDQDQLQQSINNQRRDIIALQRQLNGESRELPINEMESYLIGRLQRLSWESGVQLVSVRPGKAKRVIEFDEISFEVSVAGEYRKLFKWLNSLGDSLGFVMVTRHKILPSPRSSNDNNLNMDATLVFYRTTS